jgi:hypothetical protein
MVCKEVVNIMKLVMLLDPLSVTHLEYVLKQNCIKCFSDLKKNFPFFSMSVVSCTGVRGNVCSQVNKNRSS